MQFRRGDIRADGYVFFAYRKTQIRKDGTYRETWLSKENFDKRFEKKGDKKGRINRQINHLSEAIFVKMDGYS